MAKTRTHNEYFRPVFVTSVPVERRRDEATIQDILSRHPGTERSVWETYTSYVTGTTRKSCPTCKAKLEPGEYVWSWFEYVNLRQQAITRFCKACFDQQVKSKLADHVESCGCEINFIYYSAPSSGVPEWLRWNAPSHCPSAQKS